MSNPRRMFVAFQRLRLSIPEIKSIAILNNLINKLLDKKHPDFKNLRKGLKYEWRAYWFVYAWLNKKKLNYSIFITDIKTDLKGVDLYAISNEEKGTDKVNVEFRFQIKPKGIDDIDPEDYPLVTHFIFVGRNFIQIVKKDTLANKDA